MSRKSLILLRKGGSGVDNIFFDPRTLKYLGEGAIIGKTVRIRHPQHCIISDGDHRRLRLYLGTRRNWPTLSYRFARGDLRRRATLRSRRVQHDVKPLQRALRVIGVHGRLAGFAIRAARRKVRRRDRRGHHRPLRHDRRAFLHLTWRQASRRQRFRRLLADQGGRLSIARPLRPAFPSRFRGWRTVPDRAPQFLQQLSKVVRKDA